MDDYTRLGAEVAGATRKRIFMTLWAILAALLSISVAGCLSENLEDDVREFRLSSDGIHSFSALLRDSEGFEKEIRLTQTASIMDKDGTFRTAYQVRVIPRYAAESEIVYYLDASLHVARLDRLCSDGRADCMNYSRYEWWQQGDLPPYGIGWLHILATDDELWTFEPRMRVSIPTVLDTRDGSVVMEINPPASLGNSTFPVRLVYRPGSLAPKEFDGWQVVDYQQGPSLGLVDFWPFRSPQLKPETWRGDLFPGSETDDLDVGTSHEEWLLHLRLLSNEADNVLRGGGCVVSYTILKDFNTAETVLDPSPQPQAFFIIRSAQEAMAYEYTVSSQADFLGRRTFMLEDGREYPASIPCDETRSSPWPSISVSDFLAVSARRMPEVWGIQAFSQTMGFVPALGDRPAENSWHVWVAEYLPFDPRVVSSQSAYAVYLDPNTGWLEAVQREPGAF